MSVAETWDIVSREGRSEPGWHGRRVCVGSPCDIRAAVGAPGGVPALLFEIAARSLPAGAELPTCVGFDLSLEVIEPGSGGRIRLCLVLRSTRYRDVFATLAEDVAGIVAGAPNEATGIKLLLGRLHTWERFLSRFGPDLLTTEQQVGLFAEVRFLVDEVMPLLAAASAVRAWRGPLGEPHDFRLGVCSIEVKSTTARGPQVFQVANLDQLDDAGLSALIVHHVAIEADAPGGQTLPEAVAEARGKLAACDPAAGVDLDALLMEVGYIDAYAYAYDTRYRLATARWLEVAGAFPRLTRAGVPAGIANASYAVSLHACTPFALDGEIARRMIREGIQ